MVTTLLFDFDGTIADTLPSALDILNDLSHEFHYPMIGDEDKEKFREFTIPEIMRMMHVPFWKLPFIAKKAKDHLAKKVSTLHPVVGIQDALCQLSKDGYTLGIVTSNNKKIVENFLIKNKLDMFQFISTGSSLFGKEKKLKVVLDKYKLSIKNTVYIGDEMRDIDATKKLGMKIISVTWGMNNKKGLKKYHPDYIIDSPDTLAHLVQSL